MVEVPQPAVPGFCILLKNIRVRDGGYVFLISSGVVMETELWSCDLGGLPSALTSVFKVLSRNFAKRGVSCINIAPGLINTERTASLFRNAEKVAKSLPMGRMERRRRSAALSRA